LTRLQIAVAIAVGALAVSLIAVALTRLPDDGDGADLSTGTPRTEQGEVEHGTRLAEVADAAEARVSAEEAEARALEVTAAILERPATSLDVTLVRVSYEKTGPDGRSLTEDRLAWKVTFHGTRTRSQGGRESTPADAAALDRSVTWVLIDAVTGEAIATHSVTPGFR
jgi:Peptidase propeptide and YPEB domain.